MSHERIMIADDLAKKQLQGICSHNATYIISDNVFIVPQSLKLYFINYGI